ncbi:MAG: hypothetical protein HQK57_00670 [Deltaproteobacteria bacterium]|nr:hypothetical protein [Deltaproteobacteria bacterium]MBF0507428.1 hypothetical protein [Deltaproteobacteria bacterium]
MKNQNRTKPLTYLIYACVVLLLCWVMTYDGYAEEQLPLNQISLSPCGYEGGGRFTSIAIDPRHPEIIFIGSDVSGIYKSVDGGKSFQMKGQGLESFAVADILIHPDDSRQVFVLTDDGLYASPDGGETWLKHSEEIRYNSRQLGNNLILCSGGGLWVATPDNGVWQVELGGPTGRQAHRIPGLEKFQVNCLSLLGPSVYAGTDRGVFRLIEEKWQPWSEGLDPDQREIVNMAAHPNGRLYVVEKRRGVYVWNGEKMQWEARRLGLMQMAADRLAAFKLLGVAPQNPDLIFLGIYPETWPRLLYKSSDGGNSWKKITEFHFKPGAPETFAKGQMDLEKIAFSPGNPRRLYLTDWMNVWQSPDEGENWYQVHRGLQNTVINDIRVHPMAPARIFLAVADNGIVVSNDHGKTWKRKMTGLPDGHALQAAFSGQDPQKIYVLMNPWNKKEKKFFVYRSLNGGESWDDLSFPVPGDPLPKLGFVDGAATNLAVDPKNDDTVYLGANGYGVFKSVDGGKNWKRMNQGLTTPYIKGPRALMIDPENPKTIYAGTLQGGVYQSINGGESWTPISPGHPFTFGMAIAPSNPSRLLVACAEKKMIISEDKGKTWKVVQLPGKAPAHITAYAVAVHPAHPNLVVVGTLAYSYKASDGLFVSRNGGVSFEPYPLGDVPRVSVNVVEMPQWPECRFLVGLNGSGPFEGRMDKCN